LSLTGLASSSRTSWVPTKAARASSAWTAAHGSESARPARSTRSRTLFKFFALLGSEDLRETVIDLFLQCIDLLELFSGQTERITQERRQYLSDRRPARPRPLSTGSAAGTTLSRLAARSARATGTALIGSFIIVEHRNFILRHDAVTVAVSSIDQGLQSLIADFIADQLAVVAAGWLGRRDCREAKCAAQQALGKQSAR
jgi:hypothetical protein